MEVDYVRVYQQGALDVKTESKEPRFQLFPNPVTDQLIIKNTENSKQKFVKRDYSHYKLRDILFSGTQKPIEERNNEDDNNSNSNNDSNITYIFAETIIINLDNILNYYSKKYIFN